MAKRHTWLDVPAGDLWFLLASDDGASIEIWGGVLGFCVGHGPMLLIWSLS